jgi:plasmid stabilization system protein ParE
MDVVFLAPAQAEFAEAVGYYNAQREGLGEEFAEEVQRTIARIREYPEAWSLLSRRTRRCPTNRFPYGIIYQIRGNTLLIIAVMHLHRAPQTWRSRLPRREQ